MTQLEKSTEEPAGHVPLSSAERNKLRILFAAHVILGLLFAIWAAVKGELPIALSYLLVVPVFGFVLAQAALLGFWTAFSSAKWWMRVVAMIIGSAYFEFLLHIGGQDGGALAFWHPWRRLELLVYLL